MTAKKVFVDIKEVKRPDREAQLVAESIAQQLENRVSFRRAMKSTMSRSMKAGVLGIKTKARFFRLREIRKGAINNVNAEKSKAPQTVPWNYGR